MKYKLTKLEKLKMHRLMWLWIAEKVDRSKFMWHDIYSNIIDRPMHFCFLCELYIDNDSCDESESGKLSQCPLGRISEGFCELTGPYRDWRRSDDDDRKKYARRIAHCADKLIAELEGR